MKVRKGRILCIGLICIDVVTECKSFPVENTLYRTDSVKWQKGGNAANTSAVLGMLGDNVDFFGSLPKSTSDFTSELMTGFVTKRMAEFGVCMDHILFKENISLPFSVIVLNKGNDSRTILHNNDGLPEPSLKDFKKLNLEEYAWVHFEGRNINEVVLMIDHMVAYNNAQQEDNRIMISVELESIRRTRLERLMKHADLIVIGQEYVEHFGCKSAPEAIEKYKPLAKHGAYIVCPWGEEGASYGVSGSQGGSGSTPAVPPDKVVDTLGAGDTFLAGTVHALYHGRDLPGSVGFACKVAGLKVGHSGYSCLRGFKE